MPYRSHEGEVEKITWEIVDQALSIIDPSSTPKQRLEVIADFESQHRRTPDFAELVEMTEKFGRNK